MEDERSLGKELNTDLDTIEVSGLDIARSPEDLLSRFAVAAEVAEEQPEVAASPEPEPETVEAAVPDVVPVPEAAVLPPRAELSPVELQERLLREMPVGDLLPDPFADEEQQNGEQKEWFVVHCYSGSEQKVQHNLQQRVESMGMQGNIYQVVVPTVEEIEIKDGERKTVERCLYPGYILVQMIFTEDAWYMVRNTPGVTGFVGTGHKPIPLRREQVKSILHRMEEEAPRLRTTFQVNEKVRIVEGPFVDFIGMVQDIDEARAKLHVLVSFFGRETPVELDFLQIEKA